MVKNFSSQLKKFVVFAAGAIVMSTFAKTYAEDLPAILEKKLAQPVYIAMSLEIYNLRSELSQPELYQHWRKLRRAKRHRAHLAQKLETLQNTASHFDFDFNDLDAADLKKKRIEFKATTETLDEEIGVLDDDIDTMNDDWTELPAPESSDFATLRRMAQLKKEKKSDVPNKKEQMAALQAQLSLGEEEISEISSFVEWAGYLIDRDKQVSERDKLNAKIQHLERRLRIIRLKKKIDDLGDEIARLSGIEQLPLPGSADDALLAKIREKKNEYREILKSERVRIEADFRQFPAPVSSKDATAQMDALIDQLKQTSDSLHRARTLDADSEESVKLQTDLRKTYEQTYFLYLKAKANGWDVGRQLLRKSKSWLVEAVAFVFFGSMFLQWEAKAIPFASSYVEELVQFFKDSEVGMPHKVGGALITIFALHWARAAVKAFAGLSLKPLDPRPSFDFSRRFADLGAREKLFSQRSLLEKIQTAEAYVPSEDAASIKRAFQDACHVSLGSLGAVK